MGDDLQATSGASGQYNVWAGRLLWLPYALRYTLAVLTVASVKMLLGKSITYMVFLC
jgi:hypothetical protein